MTWDEFERGARARLALDGSGALRVADERGCEVRDVTDIDDGDVLTIAVKR